MMNEATNNADDEKLDLKHDTMEFVSGAEGEDLAAENILNEDEEMITSEELEILDEEPEVEAAALEAVEKDLETDEDIMPEEDWLDDIPGGDAIKEDANGEEDEIF